MGYYEWAIRRDFLLCNGISGLSKIIKSARAKIKKSARGTKTWPRGGDSMVYRGENHFRRRGGRAGGGGGWVVWVGWQKEGVFRGDLSHEADRS